MVMHARKHPRLSDGYFERNTAHPYEGSTRYSKSPFGEGCNDKSPANENALCNDSPDSRPSPRYYNKSSYSQRLKEREREHMDSSSIKSPLPKDRNNRSREHQTSSNSSSSSLSRKGFDGPLGTATSSNSSSRTNHDRGSHPPEEKEKRLQVGEWSEHVSSSGKKYYYNCRTEVSQWEKPREWIEWEKHQGIYKPLESNRTKGSTSSKSSEKHSNSSSAAGGSGGSSSAVSSNPNSVSASFRGSQSHHSSSHGQPQQSSTGRQASSSHALQSSGGSSSSTASSGGRGGRPASSEEHHSSSSHPHHHSSHHQHHNSNNAHHQSHSTSSASSSSHHHGRGGHEDHHQVGSTFSSSENRSNTSNSLDHRHHHHSGSRRESLKSREDSQAQDMDISPDTSEAGHHSQQENSRPHLSHQQTPHGQHSNEQGSHHQQRAQCRTPTSKGSSSSSLATAQLLSPSQVTLANLPKLISQMAGTKGLPNLKELSPEEALQTIQQALQLTKQLGGLNRSPHGASLIVSDHQHKVSAVSPIVSQSQSQPQQQQQTNSTSNINNNNSNNNNCSLSSGGSHGLPPFVPSHGDGKDGGGASPVSECNTHSSRQASPTSSVSSLPSLPAAGSSSLASLKPVTPSLTPSLANYFREDLIGHVTGWQADHAERQASRYSEEAHSIGSLNCTRVSAELKMARSLVRLAEIQATLQEQRILFLRQQVKELEDRRSQNSFISDT